MRCNDYCLPGVLDINTPRRSAIYDHIVRSAVHIPNEHGLQIGYRPETIWETLDRMPVDTFREFMDAFQIAERASQ